MGKQLMLGVAAAVFAAFAWSLGFIAPYVIGPYSIYDLAVCRFLISGVLALGILLAAPGQLRGLTALDWLVAAWLGLIGYVGYFLTIAAAVIYAGPIIPRPLWLRCRWCWPSSATSGPTVLPGAAWCRPWRWPWWGCCWSMPRA